MDQATKETLVKAIELIRAGDPQAAAPLLAKILKTEPELVQGWYLLGLALDDREQKIRAFKRVLKLDPNHEKAQTQLQNLESSTTADWAPFSEAAVEPEVEPTFEPETPVQDDFRLPDWMQAPSFDPTDYSSETPESAAQNIYEDANAEIPEWAQQNPLETAAEDQTAEFKTEQPFENNIELDSLRFGLQESELTGYYDDYEDEVEQEEPDWEAPPTEEDQEYADRVKAFFAEEDKFGGQPDQAGQPEWLREMVDEDDSGKKKKKKKEKVPKKLLSPDQKRRRRKIITYLFVLLVCIGLGFGGYTYQEELKPYVEPYLSPLLTRAAPVTDLLTQGAPITYLLTPNFNVTPTTTSTPPHQPTMEPTWTPSGGQAPISTLAPNQPAPGATTITATALPLPEDTIAEMQAIEEQVKAVRNLPGPMNIEREIMPNYKLRQVMEGQLINDEILDQLKLDEIVLRALGFINANSDYNLTQAYLNSRGDALGGFYDPELNKVNLVGSGFLPVEKYIYTHEYAHALQDANFDLNGLGYFPTCTKPLQACLAIRALVEGDASLVDQQWLDQYPPETGFEEIQNYQPPEALFQAEPEPPYFSMNNYFADKYGLAFAKYLYDNGGWNGVNRAYAVLPETTEQIMHPIKYQQREAPLYLDHPDLSPVFRGDWELIRRDMLGEWESYLLLAYNDYTGAKRPEAEASVAAEGWGADEYRVYYNPASNDVFLSAYWIWDTAAEANQFQTALFASLSTRFGSNQINGPGESGTCWFYAQQLSCLYQNEQQVLWLMSDDQEILEAAKAKFSKFP